MQSSCWTTALPLTILDPLAARLLRQLTTFSAWPGGARYGQEPGRDAVSVGSKELVRAGAEPSERRQCQNPGQPSPRWEFLQDRQPPQITAVPSPIRRKDMHLAQQFRARVRCLGGNRRIVKVAEIDSVFGVIRFNKASRPPAKLALAVGINANLRDAPHVLV